MPVALYELHPDTGTLIPIPDATGGVSGYCYRREDGQDFPVEARDVVRFTHPDPTSAYRTSGLLQQLAYQLDAELHARIYERDTVQHGQFPPVMLTTDEVDADPDQLIQYGREFKKRYIDERDGIPVVGAGLKAIRTGFTPEDLALIDSQKLRDTHILWITGVPEGLLSDKANRANAEAARLTFYATTVQDEADAIADRLGFGLERAFGSRPGALRVTAPDLTPTDAEQQSRIDRSDTESGLQSINEIRRRRGLDPVAGGDVHMVSAAMVPLESASITPPKEDKGKGDEDEDEGGAKKPERSTRSVSAILRRATRADATEAELSAAWKRIDRARRRAIAPTEMEARRLFAEQSAAAVAALESLRSADGETRARRRSARGDRVDDLRPG